MFVVSSGDGAAGVLVGRAPRGGVILAFGDEVQDAVSDDYISGEIDFLGVSNERAAVAISAPITRPPLVAIDCGAVKVVLKGEL